MILSGVRTLLLFMGAVWSVFMHFAAPLRSVTVRTLANTSPTQPTVTTSMHDDVTSPIQSTTTCLYGDVSRKSLVCIVTSLERTSFSKLRCMILYHCATVVEKVDRSVTA